MNETDASARTDASRDVNMPANGIAVADNSLQKNAVLRLEPFVREIRYQMDNCGATNKSQFSFGGIALLLIFGLLDSIGVYFMVVGHTKFGPDDVARAVAGSYQRLDTFNFAMFMQHVLSCASGEAYDGSEILRDFRAATERLFAPVDKIMSFRVFFLVGDDGHVDLGQPEDPKEIPIMFPRKGRIYRRDVLFKQIKLLKERSLVSVMTEVFEKRFQGVGSGSGRYGPVPERLLPSSAESIRNVRLFCALKETDSFVMEQEGWFKPSKMTSDNALQCVNESLVLMKPYDQVEGKGKEPYGARKEQLRILHSRHVPKCSTLNVSYVPDMFDVETARSTKLRQLVFDRGQLEAVRLDDSSNRESSSGGRSVNPNLSSSGTHNMPVRYNQMQHDDHLISILKEAEYQSRKSHLRAKDWKAIASRIPCPHGKYMTEQSVKNATRRLLKAGKV